MIGFISTGDTIGLYQTQPCLAYINNDDGTRAYKKQFNGNLQGGYGQVHTYNFLFEAYIARPVEVVVKKTYPGNDCCLSLSYKMKIFTEFNIATGLGMVKFPELNFSKF